MNKPVSPDRGLSNGANRQGPPARKILLVEDEAVTAMDIKTNLILLGYEVPAVIASGEEAVARAAELRPDCILMDISLQGAMNGIDAALAIQKTQSIPIVYLTAHADPETFDKAMTTSPFGYLPKPCNIATLMSTIEVALYKTKADARRRAIETALKESEKHYHMLFSSMKNGFSLHEIMLDPEGRPCDYRFLEVNPAFEGMTGLRGADIIGKTAREVLPNIEPYWIESFGQVALTGRAARLNNYTAEPGRYYEVEAYCPEPGLFATIITDCTEKKHLEEQLRQAQKMESIGQFAGGIAHDFNNILTAITGYGSLALSEMKKDNPQRRNIQEMLNAAERAANLTRDLLLFSRKKKSERRPLDLNATISRLEKFLKRIIGEDVECRTSLFSGPALVLGDEGQLQQVLMNLATNARDAMPGRGTFSISTEVVNFDEAFLSAHDATAPGPYIMISVSDSGRGMDKSTLEHIFEPFFTTKEEGKGTGLGLAVVFGIVKQHDGFIDAASDTGQGTTFKICLPLIAATPATNNKAAAPRATGGNETILLAEDDESVRELVKTVLENNGYRVITAVDGLEALSRFKENRDTVHLLLFDVIMPNLNGLEAYEEIKMLCPEIKIILQSGYPPDLLQEKTSFTDGIAMISKPIVPGTLLTMVRDELDNKRPTA